jgi:hypothetical protein
MKLLFFLLPLLSAPDPSAEKIEALIQFMMNRNGPSEYAILVDMSAPSTEKRLFLVELSTKKIVYSTFVAHGKGSGTGAQATFFSDKPGSLCTALGKYKVGKNYTGQHGDSYELIGLETSNANAMSRAIVIHSAWYAEEDFIQKSKRCGNSWGCPAVSPEALKKLKPYLKDGVILWIYQ